MSYDQWKTASPYDDEPDILEIREYTVKTNPYGKLEFAIGSGDDFICMDYQVNLDEGTIILHSVLNSETGSFIQDLTHPAVYLIDNSEGECDMDAVEAAQDIIDCAIDWCVHNEIEHDSEGWNQDAEYFLRYIKSLQKTEGRIGHAERFAT